MMSNISDPVPPASLSHHHRHRQFYPRADADPPKAHIVKSELHTSCATVADFELGTDVATEHSAINDGTLRHVKEEEEEDKEEGNSDDHEEGNKRKEVDYGDGEDGTSEEGKEDTPYYIDQMPKTMSKKAMPPSPPFSMRSFVSSVRCKDFLKCWPFSTRILEKCLMHGMKVVLPPFCDLPSTTYSSNIEEKLINNKYDNNAENQYGTNSDNEDINSKNSNTDKHISSMNSGIQTSCSGYNRVASNYTIENSMLCLTPEAIALTPSEANIQEVDFGLTKSFSSDFQALHNFLKKDSEEIESSHYSCCLDANDNYIDDLLIVDLTADYLASNVSTSCMQTLNAWKDLDGVTTASNALKPSSSQNGTIQDLIIHQSCHIRKINITDKLCHEHMKYACDSFPFTSNNSLTTSAASNDTNEKTSGNPISLNASTYEALSHWNTSSQNAMSQGKCKELNVVIGENSTQCKSLVIDLKQKSEGKLVQVTPRSAVVQVICPVCLRFSTTSNTALNAHMDHCLMIDRIQESIRSKRRNRVKKMRSVLDIYAVASTCNIAEELESP